MVDVVFNSQRPNVLVVDNFYKAPEEIRALALQQEFVADKDYHKGKRSKTAFLFPYVREEFMRLLQAPISNWTAYGTNGVFQYCDASQPMVIHSDAQSYAAAVYLTPGAPLDSGTWFWRSKATGLRAAPTPEEAAARGLTPAELEYQTYNDKLLDQTAWDRTDAIANVFNRLVIWNAKLIHSAGLYFGPDDPAKSRLFQLFFFDIDG